MFAGPWSKKPIATSSPAGGASNGVASVAATPSPIPESTPSTPVAKEPTAFVQPRSGILGRLGLHGMEGLEAPVLAAVASESPLLLIGPHGTAKSLLLTRLAAALELPCRHYNASLLNFDDLVGFPLPATDGSLQYVRTPAAIWGAGAVFFDEISRCRPEVQNKLFSIVHERCVQGMPIEGLRHRWAAMNPPMTGDTDSDEADYLGSEPLDAALADRFPFILEMPTWTQYKAKEQVAVIRAEEFKLDAKVRGELRAAVELTQALYQPTREAYGDTIVRYVSELMSGLAKADLPLSPRRAGMLFRVALSMYAASSVLVQNASIEDVLLAALQSSMPLRAQGRAVDPRKLFAAHKSAVGLAKLDPDSALHLLISTRDPLQRLRLAMTTTGLSRSDLSDVVADTLAELPDGALEAASVCLFESGLAERLNAAVAGQFAETYRELLAGVRINEVFASTSMPYRVWQRAEELIATLDPSDPRSHLHANAVARLFKRKPPGLDLERIEKAFHAFAEADLMLRAS